MKGFGLAVFQEIVIKFPQQQYLTSKFLLINDIK